MLTLWDNPDSTNGLKVRFLLAELGLEHDTRLVPLTRPRPAEYLALNPLGGIPTLQDGTITLSESQAILRYLTVREGRDDLYPAGARERAIVDQFLERWTNGLRTALFRVEMHALGWTMAGGFSPQDGDLDKARAAEAEIAPQMQVLDGLVGAHFTVLDRFTIADCAVAPALHRTLATGQDLDPFPALRSLREGLLTRPAWAAASPGL
jgi:glutathione S-transferase